MFILLSLSIIVCVIWFLNFNKTVSKYDMPTEEKQETKLLAALPILIFVLFCLYAFL